MNDVAFIRPADIDAAAPDRPRQRQKRQLTEEGIIDAFERLLVREGVVGLGVNALIKEAGVGKKPIYEYFSGLSGVATEWVRRRGVWPRFDELIEEDMAIFAARSPIEKICIVNRNYARMLRSNAPMCELLTGEFTRQKEVKEAIEHVRQLVRLDFERLMESDPTLRDPAIMALNSLAYAACTYVAMRAHSQPSYFGSDLSDEASWEATLAMFGGVLARVKLDGPANG